MNKQDIVVKVGSAAIIEQAGHFYRKARDVDYLSNVNMEGSDVAWDDELVDILNLTEFNGKCLPLDDLYNLKVSHLAWDLSNKSWGKHIKDAIFLRDIGCAIDYGKVRALRKVWSRIHGTKDHIKVTGHSEQFFNCEFPNVPNHDDIHLLFNRHPVYKLFLKDDNDIEFCKTKWNRASDELKIQSIVEESLVLALERRLTIAGGIKHFITKCSKGNVNIFAIDNVSEVLAECNKHRALFRSLSKQFHVNQN